MSRSYNVVILEKDPAEADGLEMQIKKSGLKVSTIRVGTKEVYRSTVKDLLPDLVVANFQLPRFDILAALEEAKELIPGVPWIVVAGTATEEQAVGCMKAGAADFITKKNMARLTASAKGLLERPKVEKAPEAAEPKKHREPAADPMQELYRLIVEYAPELIASVKPDGRREYNNPAYENILDEPDILIGTDSFVDIHPDDRERVKAIFREILARGAGRETEYRLMDKDGNTRFIESCSSIVPAPDGKPGRVIVFSRDVSHKVAARHAFEALVAATAGVTGEQFFSTLVQHIAEALGVHTVLLTRVLNEERTLVRSLAFWSGGSLHPPIEYEVAGSPCERVVRDGVIGSFPDAVQHPFALQGALGALNAESYLGVPLPGADGRPLGHLVCIDTKSMTDVPRKEYILRIFAHRSALEILRLTVSDDSRTRDVASRNMESRLRTALEGFPEPIVMTDEQDVITLVNNGLERLTGFRAQQLIGQKVSPLVLQSGSWQLLKEEYPELIFRSDKIAIPVTVYAIPCRNAEGRIAGTLSILKPKDQPGTGRQSGEGMPSAHETWLDQLGSAVLVRTLDDRILYWNSGASDLYGWSADEVQSKTFSEVFAGRTTEEVTNSVRITVEKGEWVGDCRDLTKGGREIQVESRWTLIRSPEGMPQAILILNTESTQRRAREATASRRDRLEGVSLLAGSVANDLQELTAPILLAAESLGSRQPDEGVQKLAEVITQKTRKLDDLFKQVVMFSIHQEGEPPVHALPQGKGQLVMIFDPDTSIRTLFQTTLEANGYRTIPADDAEEGLALYSQHVERIKVVLLHPGMTDIEGTPLGIVLRTMNSDVNLIATSDPRATQPELPGTLFGAFISRPFSAKLLLETLARTLS